MIYKSRPRKRLVHSVSSIAIPTGTTDIVNYPFPTTTLSILPGSRIEPIASPAEK